MDPLTAASLAGTIFQILDFGTRLLGKSTELTRSATGRLDENIDIETATADLARLSGELQQPDTDADDDLRSLCRECDAVAAQLLAALKRIALPNGAKRWQSFTKALKSIWSEKEIHDLQRRVDGLRSALNLRLTTSLRVQLSAMQSENETRYRDLDDTLKAVVDAIVEGRDISAAMREVQSGLVAAIREEHVKTREMIADLSAVRELDNTAKDVLRWLDAPDPSTNHRKARKQHKAGTGQWVLKHSAYQKWKRGLVRSIWLYGIPGCGKSVLGSTIIEDLFETAGSADTAVLYFYFDFSDPHKQSPELMLRSLLAQLVRACVSLPQAIADFFSSYEKSTRQPSFGEYVNVLKQTVSSLSNVYIALDALDECGERHELLDLITSMSEWTAGELHVLLISRRERSIAEVLDEFVDEENKICFESEKVDEDIRAYVVGRLSSDKRLQKWQRDQTVCDEIETVLMRQACGMFRWASCQLDILANCRSRAALAKALRSLPSTLDETYERILCAIPDQDAEIAVRALRWLVFGRMTFSLDQMAELVAIDFNRDGAFDENEVLEDPYDISDICSSLVTITTRIKDAPRLFRSNDQEAHVPIVVLAHRSVKEYLTSPGCREGAASRYALVEEDCLGPMVQGRLGVLMHGSHLPAEESSGSKIFNYCAVTWLRDQDCVAVSDRLANSVAKFLRDPLALTRWYRIWEPSAFESPLRERTIPLDQNSQTRTLEAGGPCPQGLYFACGFGFRQVAQQLVDCYAHDVNARGGPHWTPLQTASYGGHTEVVEFLLRRGADVNVQGGKFGTALRAASFAGHQSTVGLLLDSGALVNAQCGNIGTALEAASARGHGAIIGLLLRHGAGSNMEGNSSKPELGESCFDSVETTTPLREKALEIKSAVCAS